VLAITESLSCDIPEPPERHTLTLHDALPISARRGGPGRTGRRGAAAGARVGAPAGVAVRARRRGARPGRDATLRGAAGAARSRRAGRLSHRPARLLAP